MSSGPKHLELYDSVMDIDFNAWQKSGIKVVCLDVDGTLTSFNGTALDPKLIAHIQRAARAGMRFMLVTNNIFGNRLRRMQAAFGGNGVIEAIQRQRYLFDRKPWPHLFFRAMRASGLDFSQMAMVGDTYHTDIQPALKLQFGRVAWVKGYKKSLIYRLLYAERERRLRRSIILRQS